MDYQNTQFVYDQEPLLKKSIAYLYSKVWEYANITGVELVLDAGCGSGGLAKHVNYYNYVGLDLSLLNLYNTKKEAHISLINGSIINLPFSDASFDRIICCEVLEHFNFADQIKIMKEFYRVLVPGGIMSLSVPNAYYLWCYLPYHLFPIKRRCSLEKLEEAYDVGMYDENHEKFKPHYRFTPSYLKVFIEGFSEFSTIKETTTYWYNNRYLKYIPKKMQKVAHSLLTGGVLGSQIVCQCTK